MQSRGVNCVRTTSPRITNQTTNHYKYSNDRTTDDQTLEASYYYVLDFQPRCNQVSQQQSTAGASPGSLWLIKGLFFGAVDCFYQSSPRMINIRRNDTMHRSSKGVCTIASCSNQLYNCVDSSQSRAVVHYYVSIKGSGTLLRVNQGQWYNTTCRKHSS